jgi:hypothetical protein
LGDVAEEDGDEERGDDRADDHPVTGHRELLGPLNQTAMSRQVFAVCQTQSSPAW